MVLEISATGGTTVIALPRRFDVDSAPQVENEMQPVILQHPERLIFDFAKTDYISSAGVRMLLKLTRAITNDGGAVALCSLNRQTSYVFEITGFTKIFTIFPSREKALKHLKRDH